MPDLRTPSPRPTVVVDPRAGPVGDSANAILGIQGPFGRDRVLSALPLGVEGPWPPLVATLLIAPDARYPADPANILQVSVKDWIPRMLSAGISTDTRRLGP